MRKWRQLWFLGLSLFATLTLVVIGVSYWNYSVASQNKKHFLQEIVEGRASIIQAVARFDFRNYQISHPDDPEAPERAWAQTLSQLAEAQRLFEGFGRTGEFVLGERRGDQIYFHLGHRNLEEEPRRPLALDSPYGEPIKAAIAGNSGFMKGLDFSGTPVYAAYRSLEVNGLRFGLVVKMNSREIRQPYLVAGILGTLASLPVSIFLCWLVFRIGRPILEESESLHHLFTGTFEQAAVGLAHVSKAGSWIRANGTLCEILGYSEEELQQKTFLEITHPEDRQENQRLFRQLLAGEIPSYVFHKRFLRKDGKTVWSRVTTAVQHGDSGEFLYCISVIEDISEERKIEERLRQSEAHLRYATEEIGIGVWEYRLDEQRVIKSPNLARLLGINPVEMSEEHDFLEKRIHPDDLEKAQKHLDHYLQNPEGNYQQEFRVLRSDGSYRWLRTIGGPTFDEKGSLVRLNGVHIDVTEEMEAELRLVEHHDQFLRILDAFPEMLYVIDPENDMILFANRKVEEVLGGDISGLICHPTLHGSGETCPYCTKEPFSTGSGDETLQWEHYFESTNRYYQVTDQLISWTDGRKVRLEFAIDITVRKKNEAKLEALSQDLLKANNELRLQGTALNSTVNGVTITDAKGTILWTNPAFQKMYGYEEEEILGKTPRVLKSGFHDKAFYQGMWKTILSGHSWSDEVVNQNKQGKRVDVLLSITPILDEDGQVWRFVGIANDITEERLLQKQFIQSQRMEGIGTLAGGIAHDLNNILAPILISTEMLLKRQSLDERTREYLEIVHKSSQRGADVVRQLLTFARGQSGKEDVFLPEVQVKEMVKMIRETFPRNIAIDYVIEQPNLCMRGDSSQLQQVLLNLCVNARDAMPEGGFLKLGVFQKHQNRHAKEDDSGTAVRTLGVSVSDTGCGMTPELQAKIFDPFFTTKETGKGTGLGLSTAVGIVKSFHGEIEVESQPGKGSTFILWFPEEVGAKLVKPLEEDLESDPGRGEAVLLVDDEETIVQTLEDSLVHAGYQVDTAENGEEALEKFKARENGYDIVVTDSNMPKMNGLQLVKEVTRIKPETHYLFITGRTDQNFYLQEAPIPEEFILEKPFFPDLLLKRIRNILDSSETGAPESPFKAGE